MIEMTTGLPGSGKTLHTIWRLKALSEKENRPIYYHGINNLQLPWLPLADPEKWYECEPNSIIIIDEAQKIFRPMTPGAGVPLHISKMEDHRHSGIDLVLITQMPMLLHKNCRMLTGRHLHVVRMFGAHRSVIHEWAECRENPKQRKDSVSTVWNYPREVFDYYKSAEVHTHKTRIPARIWFMFAAPIIAAGLFWFSYQKISGISSPKTVLSASSPQVLPGARPLSSPPGQQSEGSVLTTAQYLESRTPRVADLAFSAPVYDRVTAPVTAPYPAACVLMRGECRCYSQQGTILSVSAEMCGQIVKKGFFVAWDTADKTKLKSTPPTAADAASAAGGKVGGGEVSGGAIDCGGVGGCGKKS
ncbi:hypothetical protein GCM10027046_04290 [Uliginosibacterium flavum]|uniref:Zonular occludens toxin domain-containing protein n=1 Tax=Uliginosibacterium flavum TaxID=1396831 RepID=A0ABV2TJB0_9RHOO